MRGLCGLRGAPSIKAGSSSSAARFRSKNARGARAVVVGSGPLARAVCREASSLGAAHITLLASDGPTAERTLGALAASTECTARSYRDPLIPSYLMRADLLVRIDPAFDVQPAQVGPHLSVVDLAAEAMSELVAHRTGATRHDANGGHGRSIDSMERRDEEASG